jgi:hypothetical protein
MVTPFFHPQVSEDGLLSLGGRYSERLWQLTDVPLALEELFNRYPHTWAIDEWVNREAYWRCQAHPDLFARISLDPANQTRTRFNREC